MKWCGLVLHVDQFKNSTTLCRVIRDTEEETQRALVQSYIGFLMDGKEEASEDDKFLLSQIIIDLQHRGFTTLLNETEYSARTVMVFPLEDWRI